MSRARGSARATHVQDIRYVAKDRTPTAKMYDISREAEADSGDTQNTQYFLNHIYEALIQKVFIQYT